MGAGISWQECPQGEGRPWWEGCCPEEGDPAEPVLPWVPPAQPPAPPVRAVTSFLCSFLLRVGGLWPRTRVERPAGAPITHWTWHGEAGPSSGQRQPGDTSQHPEAAGSAPRRPLGPRAAGSLHAVHVSSVHMMRERLGPRVGGSEPLPGRTPVTSAHVPRVSWPRPPARAPDTARQSGGVRAFSEVLQGSACAGLPTPGTRALPKLSSGLSEKSDMAGCPVLVAAKPPHRCGPGSQPRASCLKPHGGGHAWWGFPRGNLKRGERLALRHQSAALFLGPRRKEIPQEGNVSQSALPSGICAKDMPGAFQKEFNPRIEAAPFSPRLRQSAQTPKRGAPGLGQQKPGTPTLLLDESHEIQEVTVTRSGLTTSFPRYPRDPLARSRQTQEEWGLDGCRQLKPGVSAAPAGRAAHTHSMGWTKALGRLFGTKGAKCRRAFPVYSPLQ